MKKLLSLVILSLITLCSNSPFAQEVMESSKVMSKGLHSSAAVEIADMSERDVQSLWESFLRENDVRRLKRDRKNDEYYAEGANISKINVLSPVNIYSKVESAGKYTSLALWVESDGAFVSSENKPEEFGNMQSFLEDFKFYVKTEGVKNDLSDQESALKDMEKDLDKLKRDNEKYHKEIAKAQETIKKAEQDIVKNEEEQKSMQEKIKAQMKVVEEVRVKLNDMKKESGTN